MTYKKDRLDNFNSIEFVKDIERKYGKQVASNVANSLLRLYCAFVDGTIMEYGRNKIPKRYIEVMRNELAQTVYDLQGGKYDFDDFEPMEA